MLLIAFVMLPASVASPAKAGNWPTYAGSTARLDYNNGENVLTPSTIPNLVVHWTYNLESKTQTQPLYIEQVATAHGTHDEVFQTTTAGKVFALNATSGKLDWKVQLPTYLAPCAGTTTDGIHGTPTIDPVAGLMYVVDNAGGLHALNIATGAEASGYPVQVITQTDLTNGAHNHSSPTLVGATLYITTSAENLCEGSSPFRGEVIAFNTQTQTVTQTFYPIASTTGGGGVWGPGGALLDPDTGSLLIATGNAVGKPRYRAYGESLVSLDTDLNVLDSNTPGKTYFTAAGDFDFGSTPTPMDTSYCPPLLSVMNKTGNMFVYQRGDLHDGPTQVFSMSRGGGSSPFIGMGAYDPTLNMLFVDNPLAATGGTYTHGAVAMIVTNPGCTLAVGWQSTFGTNMFALTTRATDPLVAGGAVWFVTGAGNSVMAFNEVGGALLWSSGTTMVGPTSYPAMVEDGQMFVQSGGKLYAWGL
jgi:outer membrane protein assembly factor BamB